MSGVEAPRLVAKIGSRVGEEMCAGKETWNFMSQFKSGIRANTYNGGLK